MRDFPHNEIVLCGNKLLDRKPSEPAKRYLAACPHWKLVPRDPLENAVWRAKLRLACLNSAATREKVWAMCAEDLAFWASSFVTIVEPRIGEDVTGRTSFIPWKHQLPGLCALGVEFGKRHFVGNKSRAQGASWESIMALAWAFTFKQDVHLGFGSKTQEDADDPKRPGSGGWKFDWIMRSLPEWMRPEGVLLGEANRSVSAHTWINPGRGNYLKAESATAGMGRGSRYTSFFFDEIAHFPAQLATEALASLIETTNSIVAVSTPNGISGNGLAFYQRVSNPGPWISIPLMWWDNESQNRGLYGTNPKTQAPIIYDRSYQFPPNYPFICDGKLRSPWYDRRCEAHGHNSLLIAQELDGSFTGSVGRPFGEDLLARCQAYVKPPIRRGHFAFDPTDLKFSGEFLVGPNGPLQVWRPLDARGRLPAGQYVVGVDIAAGTGGDWSSNSVISVFDAMGDQVAEWASHKVPPADFADLTTAFCYWLAHGSDLPFVVPERNGTAGTQFMARLMSNNYPNVYMSGTGEELRPYAKKSDKPGYWNSRVDYALAPLLNALTSGTVTIRSEACLREAGEYMYDPGGSGKWLHPGSKGTLDASAAGYNHGDRVIATGMAVHGLRERGYIGKNADTRVFNPELSPPPNSMAARMREAERRKRERDGATSCVW